MGFIKVRISNSYTRLIKALNKIRYRNLKFSVVSNNCWGGEVYKLSQKEFNTPFIGLFLMAPDYVKLVENFNFYMAQKMEFVENLNVSYPIGKLADVEIHFMHYKNQAEALDKWERRTARFLLFINEYPEKLFFKMCDRDGGTVDLLKRFHQTKHKNKVSFSVGEHSVNSDNNIIIKERDGNCVPDGVKLFHLSLKHFNLQTWFKKGTLKKYN